MVACLSWVGLTRLHLIWPLFIFQTVFMTSRIGFNFVLILLCYKATVINENQLFCSWFMSIQSARCSGLVVN